MKPTPIVLFTYNRPWHTRKTIESLQKNPLAQESLLIIYSDAPKIQAMAQQVGETRAYLKTVKGFGEVVIIERNQNFGLTNNIIDGVTSVVNQYGRVIVLEDDIVTNENFLAFMNEALEFYAKQERVMHISGWNYSIDPTDLPETFLWRVMNCWGWATWADRWQYFERNPDELIRRFSRKHIFSFNLDGRHDFWGQVIQNSEGKIHTWAIFWYAHIFMQRGLCLGPVRSLVQNIGHDGSGLHCGKRWYADPKPDNHKPTRFQEELTENVMVVQRIRRYLRKAEPSLVRRVMGRIKRYLLPC